MPLPSRKNEEIIGYGIALAQTKSINRGLRFFSISLEITLSPTKCTVFRYSIVIFLYSFGRKSVQKFHTQYLKLVANKKEILSRFSPIFYYGLVIKIILRFFARAFLTVKHAICAHRFNTTIMYYTLIVNKQI